MLIRRICHWIALAGCSLLLGSCINFRSAYVVNPCGERATVRLSSGSQPPTNDDDWNRVATVDSLSAREVDSAFDDITDGPYSVRAEFGNGPTVDFEVEYRDADPVLVVIPAELCP